MHFIYTNITSREISTNNNAQIPFSDWLSADDKNKKLFSMTLELFGRNTNTDIHKRRHDNADDVVYILHAHKMLFREIWEKKIFLESYLSFKRYKYMHM